jgi:hypothetical protein
MRCPVGAVSWIPVADIESPGVEGGAAALVRMLVESHVGSTFAFEHGPAEIASLVVAPEKIRTPGQIAVPARRVRALVVQATPSATNAWKIWHGESPAVGGSSRRRVSDGAFVKAIARV